jgi:hypothetical protein
MKGYTPCDLEGYFLSTGYPQGFSGTELIENKAIGEAYRKLNYK